MKRVILVAAVLALVGADSRACGRLRGLVGRVVHPRQAAASGGGCQSAPTVDPVRQAVGNALVQTGTAIQHTGTLILPPRPTCVNGVCR